MVSKEFFLGNLILNSVVRFKEFGTVIKKISILTTGVPWDHLHKYLTEKKKHLIKKKIVKL